MRGLSFLAVLLLGPLAAPASSGEAGSPARTDRAGAFARGAAALEAVMIRPLRAPDLSRLPGRPLPPPRLVPPQAPATVLAGTRPARLRIIPDP